MADGNRGIGLQLRSLVKASGELELSLVQVPIPTPGPDEILVRIEATPINPSDLGLLLGPADLSTVKVTGAGDEVVVTAKIAPQVMRAMAGRVDQSLEPGRPAVGAVGAGRVHAVVAPPTEPGEVGDRHQLDRRDPELGEARELACARIWNYRQ